MTDVNPTPPPRHRDALLAIAIFALAKLALHTIVNQQYGFHRDELATLDDARHLAWGYVAYPPLTPFVGRIALTLFGTSLAGFRFFAAAAQSVVIVLTAGMARRFGGDRNAQWLAGLAVAVAPVSLVASSLFQYVSFDFLWFVLLAWVVVRLAETDDPRWWMAIGLVIGLGFLTKYTMLFFVCGLAVGVLATPLRRHLGSRWLWIGAAISLLVAAPNLIWQWQHDFISLEFLKSIHARDVEIGRTDHFLRNQLFVPANPFTIPFWVAGLVALFGVPSFRRFRVLGWMVVVPFAIFVAARGRDYYTAPLYSVLYAAGATWLVSLLAERSIARRLLVAVSVILFLLVGVFVVRHELPIARVGTPQWHDQLADSGDLREEIGWPELAGEVARIWGTIPPAQRARTAIYCSNYGEAGAIDLYGPRYGLPPAISGVNSYWARGYGDPPPEQVIVIGSRPDRVARRFDSFVVAGRVPNPHRIANEESEHPDIFLCGKPREGWAALWPTIRGFG